MTERLVPDLLHPVPMVRLALPELTRALGFAFAAAGSDVALYEQLTHASLAFSSWDPACFAEDLYLPELLQKIGHLEVDGQRYEMHHKHLERVLSHPPDDLAVTRFRQHTLRELLSSPEHAESFTRIYVKLRAFRALLTESSLGYRIDAGRRRMDILEAALSAVREMAASFEGASSALLRLREHGKALLGQEGFLRVAKILELDDGLAQLDARLRVGYDGQLRHFEIVRISEDAHNPFYATRLGRIVRKLVMLVRGYRFSDYEVLNAFVDEVFHGVAGELVKFFQLMGDMEFYLAALRLRAMAERAGLKVCLPELSVAAPGEGLSRALHGLFNPHLLSETARPVPCDVVEPAHTRTLVLTGPNSGGKTRLLQALSLTQLLAQGGFVVPAREAKLVWARGMFLSISDHAAADQREGRLGTELLRIRRVFESMRLSAFVVLDELCSGTNPVEGEEIFRMVLELLRELEPQAFISTHFLQFAARLADDPGMAFLTFRQVELDAKNLPTYQFVPGVASASLAKETAARLGVTREELSRLVERQKRAASAVAPSE